MPYKPDRQRIEDAICPALMFYVMKLRDGECKEEDSPFYNVYPVIKEAIGKEANTPNLRRRLDNVIEVCNVYFAKNKIKTHKAFIIATRLGMYLYYHGAIDVQKKSDLYILWKDFYYTVRDDGMKNIEGFQKLYDSALGHLPKLIIEIQKMGYFR